MDGSNEKLTTAIKQSEQMLELAQEGDWEKVEEIQKRHSVLISQLVSDNFEGSDINHVRREIKKIQKLDHETEALALTRKERIVKDKQQQDKANRMKKAFGAFK